MKPNETVIPASYAQRLLSLAETAGCDRESILTLSQIDRGDLDSSHTEIPGRTYARLYQAVMRAAEDEWFGMFVGGKVPLGSFRMMCLALLSCSNLKQAVIRAAEFAEICRGMQVKFRLQENDNGSACLRMSPVRACTEVEFGALLANADPSHILTSIITWHKFAEWLTGKTISIRALELTITASHALQPLAYVKQGKISYGCAHNGFCFASECLDYPLVQDYDSLMVFLRTAPYHLVTEDPQKLSFAERVRNILKRDVSGAMPSAEQLAGQLSMSVTTLRRQLAKAGTSYQKLKDDCRMEAAIYFLSCLELSNADIAEKLGFDEPSAFFRSFKKWTGQTPGEYRVRLKQPD